MPTHEQVIIQPTGLGLSQYTVGNLQTALTKLGSAGLEKLKLPKPRTD